MPPYPVFYNKDGRAETMKMYATDKDMTRNTPKYATPELYKYEHMSKYGGSSNSQDKKISSKYKDKELSKR